MSFFATWNGERGRATGEGDRVAAQAHGLGGGLSRRMQLGWSEGR